MKYIGVVLVGLIVFSIGCKPEEVSISELEQFNIDLALIDNWITDNAITDTLHHSSEIRYTINQTGTGLRPLLSDTVYVEYEGRFLDTGEVFDSSTGFSFRLDQTILGWQVMLSDMEEGDDYTIYLPSFFAYGTAGSSIIPPNAVLVFDIHLIRVSN